MEKNEDLENQLTDIRIALAELPDVLTLLALLFLSELQCLSREVVAA